MNPVVFEAVFFEPDFFSIQAVLTLMQELAPILIFFS
jgi:hypothetical protein